MGNKDDRPGLTKADLTKMVYDLHGGMTKHEAAEVVNTILTSVKSTLIEGRSVKIQNFGVLEVSDRKGRAGVDPITGKRIYIPPHKGLSFRPASRLKEKMKKDGPSDS
jgi:integration host factor subunit alpha